MNGKKTLSKIVAIIIVLVLIAFVINQPDKAATTLGSIVDWIGSAGNAIGSFLAGIFN